MGNGLRRIGPRGFLPRFGRVAVAGAVLGLGAFASTAAPANASSATTAGTCLSSWPPLLMPKGTTTPGGAKCLTTVKFGTTRLQVEYMKQRLYTFTGDTGTSVNGNGLAGFKVAKVSATCP
jgi:hypothetical protein